MIVNRFVLDNAQIDKRPNVRRIIADSGSLYFTLFTKIKPDRTIFQSTKTVYESGKSDESKRIERKCEKSVSEDITKITLLTHITRNN